MVFKYRYWVLGQHVHVTVFAGVDKDHLANCGQLVMRVEEWEWFSRKMGEYIIEERKLENGDDI